MVYFYVDIETELGEMLTYYVAATDEAQAEDFATAAFENGEIECMGIQIVIHLCYMAFFITIGYLPSAYHNQMLTRSTRCSRWRETAEA